MDPGRVEKKLEYYRNDPTTGDRKKCWLQSLRIKYFDMGSSAEYFPHLSIYNSLECRWYKAHVDINNKAKDKEQIFLLFDVKNELIIKIFVYFSFD